MASQAAQRQRIGLSMQEMQVWSLSQEDLLEEQMVTHSSILAWNIPWAEEPGGLQSMAGRRVGQDWATEHAHTLAPWNVLREAPARSAFPKWGVCSRHLAARGIQQYRKRAPSVCLITSRRKPLFGADRPWAAFHSLMSCLTETAGLRG